MYKGLVVIGLMVLQSVGFASQEMMKYADFLKDGGEKLTSRELDCRIRFLSEKEIRMLRTAAVSSIPDTRSQKCREETPIYLVGRYPHWGLFDLRAIAKAGPNGLTPVTEIWPPIAYEAPICPDCDEIWIGAVPSQSWKFDKYFLIADGEVESIPGLPRFHVISKKDRLQIPHRVDENFKGLSVLLIGGTPEPSMIPVYAREIRRRGALRITWISSSLRSYLPKDQFEMRPSVPIEVIDYQQAKSALRNSVIVNAALSQRRDRRIIKSAVFPVELHLERQSIRRDLPMVFFGMGQWDPDMNQVVKAVWDLGYRNLRWYKNGFRDWDERHLWESGPATDQVGK